eukprot:gb/GECG01005582.1/.p1 GENE.gb/GECG01005582.1/~~gb/GECG01005582.1/.p1  ORF type:complete len:1126 (+),score=144.66 gb/GECG01005582.1/:1-3378(+)
MGKNDGVMTRERLSVEEEEGEREDKPRSAQACTALSTASAATSGIESAPNAVYHHRRRSRCVSTESTASKHKENGSRRTGSSKKSAKPSNSSTQTVIVNMPNCKYESVEACVRARGWQIIREENATEWNLYWTDTSVSTERLIRAERHQKLNHFPGMLKICRKTPLARMMKKMSRLFPQEYRFFPKSWVLPEEWSDFKSQFALRIGDDGRPQRPKKNRTFIIKPDAGTQGKGISLVRDVNTVNQNESSVAQKYVSKPFLIEGKKFDLRLYVLVTSVAPLRAFLFQDGLVRLCSRKYVPPKRSNLKKTKVHLTNYAINKFSKEDNPSKEEEAEYAEDSARPDRGVKRSVVWLRQWLDDNGYDSEAMWKRIADMTVKLLLPSIPELSHTYLSAIGSSRRSNSSSRGGDQTGSNNNGIAPSENVHSSISGMWTRVGGAPIRGGIGVGVNSRSNQKNKKIEVNSSCFEILGVDILLDYKLNPWLIEVNHSPSFTCDSPLDRAIKTRLIRETLALTKLRASDQRNMQQKASEAAKSRLYSNRAPAKTSYTPASNINWRLSNGTTEIELSPSPEDETSDAFDTSASTSNFFDGLEAREPNNDDCNADNWEADEYIAAEKRQRYSEALAAPGFSRIYPPHDRLDEAVAQETESKVRANSVKAQMNVPDELELDINRPASGESRLPGRVAGFPHVYLNGGRDRCPRMTTSVALSPDESRCKWAEYCKLLIAAADIFDRGTGRNPGPINVRGASGIMSRSGLESKLSAVDAAFDITGTEAIQHIDRSSVDKTNCNGDDEEEEEEEDDDEVDGQVEVVGEDDDGTSGTEISEVGTTPVTETRSSQDSTLSPVDASHSALGTSLVNASDVIESTPRGDASRVRHSSRSHGNPFRSADEIDAEASAAHRKRNQVFNIPSSPLRSPSTSHLTDRRWNGRAESAHQSSVKSDSDNTSADESTSTSNFSRLKRLPRPALSRKKTAESLVPHLVDMSSPIMASPETDDFDTRVSHGSRLSGSRPRPWRSALPRTKSPPSIPCNGPEMLPRPPQRSNSSSRWETTGITLRSYNPHPLRTASASAQGKTNTRHDATQSRPGTTGQRLLSGNYAGHNDDSLLAHRRDRNSITTALSRPSRKCVR